MNLPLIVLGIIVIALIVMVIYGVIASTIERRRKIKEKYPEIFSPDFEKAQYFFIFGIVFVILVAWTLSYFDK